MVSLCSFARANLVLVVDSSFSVCDDDDPCNDWTLIRNFLSDVVGQMNIGTDSVRVGLVRYGTSASNVWQMSDRQVTGRQSITQSCFITCNLYLPMWSSV